MNGQNFGGIHAGKATLARYTLNARSAIDKVARVLDCLLERVHETYAGNAFSLESDGPQHSCPFRRGLMGDAIASD